MIRYSIRIFLTTSISIALSNFVWASPLVDSKDPYSPPPPTPTFGGVKPVPQPAFSVDSYCLGATQSDPRGFDSCVSSFKDDASLALDPSPIDEK